MAGAIDAVNPFVEGKAGKYFVGRERELQRFASALAGLRAGQPAHLYVAGTNGRGKTSYLDRLVSQASSPPSGATTAGVLAVMLTLDGGIPALYQVVALVERLIDDVDDLLHQVSGARRLRKEWQRSQDSPFYLRGADRLHNDHLLRDLRYIQRVAAEAGRPKLVVCLDEGQRIEPFALSALKASIGQLDDFLLVLSLRLPDERDDPLLAGRLALDKIAAEAGRDLGASRLFISGVALGPFSAGQARECVTRRLDGNPISFDPEVVELIAQVSGRLPDQIISYAHEVYAETEERGATVATVPIFRYVFRRREQRVVSEALAAREQLTNSERTLLLALAKQQTPLVGAAIAARAYPDASPTTLEAIGDSVRGLLNRDTLADFVSQRDDRYAIPDPRRRYALVMAMDQQ